MCSCFFLSSGCLFFLCFFFFNDTATTEIYTLSLHDALPISRTLPGHGHACRRAIASSETARDRKSTRLNSSHSQISYAVFCLKKKKTQNSLSFPWQLEACRTAKVNIPEEW